MEGNVYGVRTMIFITFLYVLWISLVIFCCHKCFKIFPRHSLGRRTKYIYLFLEYLTTISVAKLQRRRLDLIFAVLKKEQLINLWCNT
jgi:hypothetical protein